MIDTSLPKFKTHKFAECSNYRDNRLVCLKCGFKIKQYIYFNSEFIDFYEDEWLTSAGSLEDITISCDEYIIKNIIE